MTNGSRANISRLVLVLLVSMGRLPAVSPEGSPPVYGTALLRTWVPPEYPRQALKDGLAGVVTLRLVVDARGVVVSSRVLDASDPLFVDAAQRAVKEWVFSPALDAGKPVACEMDAPIVFSPDRGQRRTPGPSLPTPDQMPVPAAVTEAEIVSSSDLDYPDTLFDRKLSGLAHYFCKVLPDGSVSNPRITFATHVDFVLPALKALGEQKYKPRMKGDEPVESDVEGILRFDLTRGSSAGALAANMISAPDGNPPAEQLEPRVVADPVFPYDLLQEGKGGAATVLFTVDDNGSTSKVRVRDASDPELGESLVAAVEMSAFSSPALGGHAVSVELMRRAEFPAIAPDNEGASDPRARLLAESRAGRIGGGTGLDAKLVPRYRVSPRYPGALKESGRPSGQAVVEFVVDRDGRARLPRIVSATDGRFGWAAATAVSQWVFDAPRRGGQPVDVRVQVPFQFKAPTD